MGGGDARDWTRPKDPSLWDSVRTIADPNRLPSYLDTQLWGVQKTQQVRFASALDELTLVYDQLVQAEFVHPVAWLVGLQYQNGGPVGFPPMANWQPQIIYGLGGGRFPQDFPPVAFSDLFSHLTVVGPTPAKTVIVSARAVVTPNPGAAFPHVASFTFGAFAAPQVWENT